MQLAMEAALDLDDGREYVVKGRVEVGSVPGRCAWNSSRKRSRQLATTGASESPSRQRHLPLTRSQTSSRRSRSCCRSRGRPRSSRGSARASGCRRGRACTCRTTRARRSAKRAAHTRPAAPVVENDPPAEPIAVPASARILMSSRMLTWSAVSSRVESPARGGSLSEIDHPGSPPKLVDQLAQGHARLRLVVAPAHDVAGEREGPRSRRVRRRARRTPRAAELEDRDDRGEGLIDDRRRRAP